MTTTHEEMKNFLKEHPFTPEMLSAALKKYDLTNITFEVEKERILNKKSNLSARQRKAVLELCEIKNVMDEIEREKTMEKEAQENMSFNTI